MYKWFTSPRNLTFLHNKEENGLNVWASSSSPDSDAQESLRVTALVASSGRMEGLFRMEVAVLSCSRLASTTANINRPEYSPNPHVKMFFYCRFVSRVHFFILQGWKGDIQEETSRLLTGPEYWERAITIEPPHCGLAQLFPAGGRHHSIEWVEEGLDNDAELAQTGGQRPTATAPECNIRTETE